MTQGHSSGRRRALHRAGGLLLAWQASQASGVAAADKPLRLVVPFPPGGVTDILARALAADLQRTLGQNVIVDNRPGASGIIGSEAVARAAPDGQTVLLAAIGQAIVNRHLFAKLPYDPNTDLVPVCLLAQGNNVLVVRSDSPVTSVDALIAAAKKAPGKLTYGSFGPGSTPHLCSELFASRTGTRFTHVPYKGSAPAVTDLLGGQIDFMFDTLITSLPNIRAGKLRALAVTGATRASVLPDVPTLSQAGVPGYDLLVWFGLFMPGGTPMPAVERFSRAVGQFADSPELAGRFRSQGIELKADSPAAYAAFLRAEDRKWGDIVKLAGVELQ